MKQENITKLLVLLWIVLSITKSYAQDKTIKKQIIKGVVVDRSTGQGLKNAYVELLNYTPHIASLSAEDGTFELKNIPVGRQRIRVEYDGYYEAIHAELVVAGKQTIVTIMLDEAVTTKIAVVEAEGTKRKDKGRYRNTKLEANDPMNAISVHPFDIDDVIKYVGCFGDPARILTNFPGLYNIDASQNYIVSRGNSPYGIQWMIEDVPIENPHHFASMGNTGSLFPLVNNNLLSNSDFTNGAMPAHYSNVYSGVFDLKMRTGNNERFEFAAQLSTMGVEVVAEGPLKKKGASFAVAFRSGILDLLRLSGIKINASSTPRYYDANFKITIPTRRAGRFSIFGIAGYGLTDILSENRVVDDLFAEPNINIYAQNSLGMIGVQHLMPFDKHTSLKTTLSYHIADYNTYRDSIAMDSTTMPHLQVRNLRQQIGLSSVFNKKINPQLTIRTGVSAYLHLIWIKEQWLQSGDFKALADDVQVLASGFFQAQYKFSSRLVLTLGLQGMYWSLNQNSWAIEPRVALNWYVAKRHKLSLGYGWHSKIQTFPISFFVQKQADGSYDRSNRELGPTRSHHLVLSYDVYLAKFWGLRTNVYAQYTTNLAVQTVPSNLSIANYGAFARYPTLVGWENTGVGFNYGIEVALEKYFSHGYYGLLSGTYQRALYRGSDLVWRNSVFDAQYIGSTVMGKEFKIGKQKRNIIYADLRFNIHGGLPYIPVDLEASRLAGYEVLDQNAAYTKRLGIYKRIDVRLGIRLNHRKKRISHHIFIEVNNVANFKNDLGERYDPMEEVLIRASQLGFFPNLFYQIRF